MMLKPSIDTLLDKVPSKYSLVILEAKRAHELEAGAPATQGFKSEKSTLRAVSKKKNAAKKKKKRKSKSKSLKKKKMVKKFKVGGTQSYFFYCKNVLTRRR